MLRLIAIHCPSWIMCPHLELDVKLHPIPKDWVWENGESLGGIWTIVLEARDMCYVQAPLQKEEARHDK